VVQTRTVERVESVPAIETFGHVLSLVPIASILEDAPDGIPSSVSDRLVQVWFYIVVTVFIEF